MSRRWALLLLTAATPAALLVSAAAFAPAGEAGALATVGAWCRVGGSPARAALVVAACVAVVGVLAWLARVELVRLARAKPEALLLHAAAAAGLAGIGIVLVTATLDVRHAPPRPRLGVKPALDAVLTDQDGARCAISSLRGRVVVATAFYSTCSTTCPMTFSAVDDMLARVTPAARERVVFVGVTLDPLTDTPARLAEIARGHGMSAPSARLLTGSTPDVEATLDALGIQRWRDARTGLIEHESALVILNPEGRVIGWSKPEDVSDADLRLLENLTDEHGSSAALR